MNINIINDDMLIIVAQQRVYILVHTFISSFKFLLVISTANVIDCILSVRNTNTDEEAYRAAKT